MKDYIYKLEKIEMTRGNVSMVAVGRVTRGYFFSVIVSNDTAISEPEFSTIKEGDMVLVRGHNFWEFVRTSPVKEIIDISQDRVVFRTQSSVYELTREIDPEFEEDTFIL